MYKFIGADGLEYGPASAEKVCEWIREGRLNAKSQARLETEASWRPLGEFPEFAALFPPPAPAAPPSHQGSAPRFAGPAPDMEALIAEAKARTGRLSAVDIFGAAWRTFTANFWGVLGVSTLFIFLGAVLGLVPIIGCFAALISGVLGGGMNVFALKNVRGEKGDVKDLFAGFNGELFVPLLVSTLLMIVFVALGFVLLILPGLYLLLAYSLTSLLVVDKGLSFWDAMEVSRRTVNDRFGLFVVLGILTFLASLAGSLALGIGVLVTTPWIILAYATVYDALFGPRNSPAGVPQPSPVAT